jgi:hypothetical protein
MSNLIKTSDIIEALRETVSEASCQTDISEVSGDNFTITTSNGQKFTISVKETT